MTRRSIALLAASHLLLLVAGGSLALQTVHPGANARHAAAKSGASPSRAAGPAVDDTRYFRPTDGWETTEYARAWNAVRGGKYTTRERVKLQRALLAKWAVVDLRAAIDAALGEAWDRDGASYYDPCGPLLDVFAPALAKNSRAGWVMIRGRQFGLGTAMLRRIWMESAGGKDPLFLASRLGDLSWRDRAHALEICENAVRSHSADVAEADIFKVLSKFPGDVISADQLVRFASLPEAPVLDLAALKQEISRLADEDDRLAMVKAMLFGKALAAEPPEEIAERIGGLPDRVREEAAWAAFKSAATPESVLALANLLIAESAWTKLEQRETVEQLQKIARSGDAEAVADWAIGLPVREQTIELFHRSVEPFLAADPDTAREWLEAMPPGVWRDRAFAEFSQVALNLHQNPRDSRWALGQIADDHFKAEAEDWRSQWEKRTGWVGN